MECCPECGKDLISEAECDNPNCACYGGLVCGDCHECITDEEVYGEKGEL